jgi:FkbM family methyltransferase
MGAAEALAMTTVPPTERRSVEGVLGIIRTLGWRPGAIIDIGVAFGTDGLYGAWPGTPICLVEPSRSALPFLEKIAARYPNVQIFNVGASNVCGEATGSERGDMVNAIIGVAKRKVGWNATRFPVLTCDEIVRRAGLEPPFLYKLDTDAHELQVLEGSAETLKRTDLAIVEVNVFNARRGRATVDQMWRALQDQGFTLMDMAGASHAPSGVLRTMDLVFVRQDSQLFEEAFQHSLKEQSMVARRQRQQDAIRLGGQTP